MTRIGASFQTAFTALPTTATQYTSQASATFVTMETSIKGTLVRIGAVFPTAFTTLYTSATQATGQTIGVFTTMQTSIQQTLGKITALFTPTFANLQPVTSQATTNASATFLTMSQSIQGTLNRIKALFPSAFTPLVTHASANTKVAAGHFNTLNSNISSSMSSATSRVNSFGNAASSAFKKVGSEASAATSKVKALASAINSLKSKSITIHVGLSGPGAAYLRTGGSFISPTPTGFAQTGKTFINSKPRKIGGVNISEFGKPELVTVTPLSNPFDPTDKNISMNLPNPKAQSIPQMTSGLRTGGGSGGNGGQPITVTGNMTVYVKIPDGRVLAQETNKYSMQGFSGIT